MEDIKKMIRRDEKEFSYKHIKLKYIFFKCKNKTKRKGLLIVFGAWGGHYNYIKQHEIFNESYDTLYLEDRFGYKHKGCYYLAEEGDFTIEKSYIKLIESIIKKTGLKKDKVLCFGGSMGGFAALYYSYKLGLAKAVAFSPIIFPDCSIGFKKMIGCSKLDFDSYILSTFRKKVHTESFIFYNKEDGGVKSGGIINLIKIMLNENNKFHIESLSISPSMGFKRRNEKFEVHASVSYLLYTKNIRDILDKNLEFKVD